MSYRSTKVSFYGQLNSFPLSLALTLSIHSKPLNASAISESMICGICGLTLKTIPEHSWIPFSRASSQPKDQIQVSSIAGRFFPSEPPEKTLKWCKYLNYHIYYFTHISNKMFWNVVICLLNIIEGNGEEEVKRSQSRSVVSNYWWPHEL